MQRAPSVGRIVVLAALSAAAFAATGVGTSSASDPSCTRVAAPGGSDSGAGTESDPFATAQRLVDSLGPGDVGCLRQGTYNEDVTVNHGGSSDSSRVVIKSYDGERATISGRLYVPDRSNYVTIEQLNLDGHDAPACSAGSTCTQLPSPTVNGDHIVFQDNDVTNRHVGICFNLGAAGYGRAVADVIQRNRIHDCGRIPSSNHDHGIYLAYSDGTQVLDNVIYDNADRGVQLYPDAQGTLIKGNVIDGNGEGVIFSGAGGSASNDNVVENNVITNSTIRHDVESWYPDVVGTGNVVRNNCVHGGAQGAFGSAYGFQVQDNLKTDPRYVDRAGKDFRLAADSPCAAVLAGASVPAQPNFTPDKQEVPPPTTSGGSTTTVTVTQATFGHFRHHRRLRVAGKIRGTGGTHVGYVQIRRFGRWQRVGTHRLHGRFRFGVRAGVPRLGDAAVTMVRIVVPGVGRSRPVAARYGHSR
jgi:parallel beta helix pectate lyase-like protein